jgi:hypothetical protein
MGLSQVASPRVATRRAEQPPASGTPLYVSVLRSSGQVAPHAGWPQVTRAGAGPSPPMFARCACAGVGDRPRTGRAAYERNGEMANSQAAAVVSAPSVNTVPLALIVIEEGFQSPAPRSTLSLSAGSS